MKGLEGLSIDEKYEIEEYRDMMKDFAMAATEGNLEQVGSIKNQRSLDTKVTVKLSDPGTYSLIPGSYKIIFLCNLFVFRLVMSSRSNMVYPLGRISMVWAKNGQAGLPCTMLQMQDMEKLSSISLGLERTRIKSPWITLNTPPFTWRSPRPTTM